MKINKNVQIIPSQGGPGGILLTGYPLHSALHTDIYSYTFSWLLCIETIYSTQQSQRQYQSEEIVTMNWSRSNDSGFLHRLKVFRADQQFTAWGRFSKDSWTCTGWSCWTNERTDFFHREHLIQTRWKSRGKGGLFLNSGSQTDELSVVSFCSGNWREKT